MVPTKVSHRTPWAPPLPRFCRAAVLEASARRRQARREEDGGVDGGEDSGGDGGRRAVTGGGGRRQLGKDKGGAEGPRALAACRPRCRLRARFPLTARHLRRRPHAGSLLTALPYSSPVTASPSSAAHRRSPATRRLGRRPRSHPAPWLRVNQRWSQQHAAKALSSGRQRRRGR
uniref:Uncharacterized protein n=1 Tax=Oryza nivara TaxID=4536 RepID=A0A0E0H4C9_ORYNI